MFDLQAALARELDLADTAAKRASEQLMQRYYRAAKIVRQVNTLLLQNLHGKLYPAAITPVAIDDQFQRVDELLDVCDEELFATDPGTMLFIQLFREPRGLTHELRRMNLYGILGQYLPTFGAIVGQMQHDLFHVYTVDEHILMVIRNLRRFTEAQHAHEYPLCSRLIADFERKEVLTM